jgi:uncharacterized protein YjiS (DUF1127 family)
MSANAEFRLISLRRAPPGRLSATWRAFRHLLRIWRQRRRERRDLAHLTEQELHDFRVTVAGARGEARCWFWQDWSPEWQDAAERRQAARRSER